MRPFVFLPALFLAATILPAGAGAQTADPARASVQALCDGLLAIMKGGRKMGFQGRAAAIGPVIDKMFDVPAMTRIAVGTGWTGIAPADQTALIAAFRRMTVNEYAGNFDSFSGQSFAVDPDVEVRGADKLVRTTLTQPGEQPVAIAYRMRQSGGSWKVIDVFYRNAISQLATRRSDFARVMATGGAKALIAHLNDLAAKAAN